MLQNPDVILIDRVPEVFVHSILHLFTELATLFGVLADVLVLISHMARGRRASSSLPPLPRGVSTRPPSREELAHCESTREGETFLYRFFVTAGLPLPIPGFIK